MRIFFKELREPGRRTLEAVATGLEEIRDHFGGEGFADIDVRDRPDGEYEGDEYEDDEEEEDYISLSYEREDIEVAVDAFISQLIADKIIRKSKSGKLPSFADVFRKIFGADHEVTESALAFEEHIEGYFGQILYDHMKAAYKQFAEIEEAVKNRLAGGTDVAN